MPKPAFLAVRGGGSMLRGCPRERCSSADIDSLQGELATHFVPVNRAISAYFHKRDHLRRFGHFYFDRILEPG